MKEAASKKLKYLKRERSMVYRSIGYRGTFLLSVSLSVAEIFSGFNT
jgi:hypothetical protein